MRAVVVAGQRGLKRADWYEVIRRRLDEVHGIEPVRTVIVGGSRADAINIAATDFSVYVSARLIHIEQNIRDGLKSYAVTNTKLVSQLMGSLHRIESMRPDRPCVEVFSDQKLSSPTVVHMLDHVTRKNATSRDLRREDFVAIRVGLTVGPGQFIDLTLPENDDWRNLCGARM